MSPDVVSRPGELTKRLQSADQNAPVSPRLTLAALTNTYSVERPAAEMSVLGQWGSGFADNRNRVVELNVLHNGYPMPTTASFKDYEDQGRRAANSYIEHGLIQQGDSVLDVGTCLGFFPKHLKLQGIDNVTSVEPDIENIKKRLESTGIKLNESEVGEISPLSTAEYAEKNPGKKFSVVNVCNFFPFYNNYEKTTISASEMSVASDMIKSLSLLTAKDGKMLLGISATNPEYVSGKSGVNLRPFLEKYFDNVEYISAKKFTSEFEQYLSIGGQMGVFKCTNPKLTSENS